MAEWPPTPLHSAGRVRRPLRVAITLSVAVHAVLVLGLALYRHQPPAPVAPADSVEVDFAVTDSPTPSSGVGTQEAPPDSQHEAAQLSERPGAKPPEHRGRRGPSETHAGDSPSAIADEPSTRGSTGQEGEGTNDRFASFRPGRPDLSRGPTLPAPNPARDLLAAPHAPMNATGELPKQIRGPGDVTARIDEDGRIHFHDPKPVVVDHFPVTTIDDKPTFGIDGHFDLNDQLARLAGQDPYAATKRKLAEETHEQRLCLARRAQHAREAQALLDLSTQVRAIAGRKDWPAEKRHRALFEIWDECDDGDSDYAAMARATITAIIRQAFPEGSPQAYQAQELLALNTQRSSRQEFAPYAAPESRSHKSRPEHCSPPDAELSSQTN